MVFHKSSKFFITLVMFLSLVLMAAACQPQQKVGDNNIPEEKLALENFLALYSSVSVSFHDEDLKDKKTDDVKTPDQMIAEYNQLDKEGKITYLRNMIEKALAENEAIGGIEWKTDLSSIQSVREVFPDLYEKIVKQDREIKTYTFSYSDDTIYHVITDENNQLVKVVQLNLDNTLREEKVGGANQTITLDHPGVGTVEIITDADNKIKSVVEIRSDGEKFTIYNPKTIK